jgi:hypothetical protein
LKREKLSNALKRKSGTIFWRASGFTCWWLRGKKKSSISANLSDAVDLVFEKRNDERLFHVPGIAEKQRVSGVTFVFVSEEYEVAGNFEFGPVSIFVHEVHVDRNGRMFSVVHRNGKKRDKELREREIGPVDFVRVIKVQVGARGFFRRPEAKGVIDSPKGSWIWIEGPCEQEPTDGKRTKGKAGRFANFVVSGPVFVETDGEKRVRNVT